MTPRPTASALVPYTTLFRSNSTFAGFWTNDKLLDTRVDKGLYVSGVSPWYDAYHKDVKVGDVLLEYGGIIAGTAEKIGRDTSELQSRLHLVCRLLPGKKSCN